jgi:hypothetical protein
MLCFTRLQRANGLAGGNETEGPGDFYRPPQRCGGPECVSPRASLRLRLLGRAYSGISLPPDCVWSPRTPHSHVPHSLSLLSCSQSRGVSLIESTRLSRRLKGRLVRTVQAKCDCDCPASEAIWLALPRMLEGFGVSFLVHT